MSRSKTLLAFCLLVCLGLPMAASGQDAAGKLRPALREALANAAPGDLVPVSVVLSEQVDAADKARVRAGLKRHEARRPVVDLLKSNAAASQGPMLQRLELLEGEGRVTRIRPLWIANVVGVDATPDVILELAARPEVAWINYNPKVDVFLESTRADEPDS